MDDHQLYYSHPTAPEPNVLPQQGLPHFYEPQSQSQPTTPGSEYYAQSPSMNHVAAQPQSPQTVVPSHDFYYPQSMPMAHYSVPASTPAMQSNIPVPAANMQHPQQYMQPMQNYGQGQASFVLPEFHHMSSGSQMNHFVTPNDGMRLPVRIMNQDEGTDWSVIGTQFEV